MNPLAYFANNFMFYFYFCANFPKSRVYVPQAAHGKAEKKMAPSEKKITFENFRYLVDTQGGTNISESVDDTDT